MEKGGRERTCAHPHPFGQPEGRPHPRARKRGQTVVLSLASGRPAPHNDPFIRLREPWAGVSSDKGGRPASYPLAGVVGRGAEPYLSWTQGHEKWRLQGSQLKPLSLPQGRGPERLGVWPQAARSGRVWVHFNLELTEGLGSHSRSLSHLIPSRHHPQHLLRALVQIPSGGLGSHGLHEALGDMLGVEGDRGRECDLLGLCHHVPRGAKCKNHVQSGLQKPPPSVAISSLRAPPPAACTTLELLSPWDHHREHFLSEVVVELAPEPEGSYPGLWVTSAEALSAGLRRSVCPPQQDAVRLPPLEPWMNGFDNESCSF